MKQIHTVPTIVCIDHNEVQWIEFMLKAGTKQELFYRAFQQTGLKFLQFRFMRPERMVELALRNVPVSACIGLTFKTDTHFEATHRFLKKQIALYMKESDEELNVLLRQAHATTTLSEA